METTLHRQLKELYGGPRSRCEVRLDGFRIDAVRRGALIEIQLGHLAAIRRKVAALLEQRRVVVVKPIVIEKTILRLDRCGGSAVRRRRSPKRGQLIDLFDDLVYFTQVFPHPRLTLEVPLISIEEDRYSGHGRRRRWRKNDFQIGDQRLVAVHEVHRFRTGADLARLLPDGLPQPFHTGHVAERLAVARWVCQRIAYCLVRAGALVQVGKHGNTRLYSLPARRQAS